MLSDKDDDHSEPYQGPDTEVKEISADRMRAIYESMTENRTALELMSIGVVRGISTVVQPPCEEPSPF
jgi:hypothetical protein